MVEAIDDGDVDEHREELGDCCSRSSSRRSCARRGRVRHRRRRARHRRQDGAPPPARLRRRRRSKDADEVLAQLGQAQGRRARPRRASSGALDGVPASAAGAAARPARRREGGARSASTGPTSTACAQRWTRSCASSTQAMAGGDHGRDRARARRRRCSRWSTWRASSASTPRGAARSRPIASPIASATSSARWRPKGRASRTPGAEEQDRLWDAAKAALNRSARKTG